MNKTFVEFFTVKECKACDVALHEIMPIIKDRNIPIVIKPIDDGVLAPSVCVVKRDNEGNEHRDCIDGLISDYSGVFLRLLDD